MQILPDSQSGADDKPKSSMAGLLGMLGSPTAKKEPSSDVASPTAGAPAKEGLSTDEKMKAAANVAKMKENMLKRVM